MRKKPKVFFNASVILAGLYSPRGGSAKLLEWCKKKRIDGYISEVVLDEAKRHADKINLKPKEVEQKIINLVKIASAPQNIKYVYKKLVLDEGDIHLFTSAEDLKVDFLISLDKKHVLSLAGQVKNISILTPGEFIKIHKKKM